MVGECSPEVKELFLEPHAEQHLGSGKETLHVGTTTCIGHI